MNIDDYFNADYIRGACGELAGVVDKNTEDLDCAVVIWYSKGVLYHRGYGGLDELLGMMTKAQYIMLREGVGETCENSLD